jgi:tetratricopeptide (TPR) repeat protein
MVRKLFSRGRLRRARQDVASNPSPMNYANLARQYAWAGGVGEALRVCEEGSEMFPGHPELTRLAQRLRKLRLEADLEELHEELAEAPRPAVWSQLCDVLLESGQHERAEETASRWLAEGQDPEAHLALARARVAQYLAELNRQIGRDAFQTLALAQEALPRDVRVWRLTLRLTVAIGAWGEARTAAQRVLDLEPGDPQTEALHRRLASMVEGAPDVDRALIHVQQSGRLVEAGDPRDQRATPSAEVRPLMKELTSRDGVNATVYVRGSTALVQGLRGATAERAARSVRSMVSSARATARGMGLGHVSELEMTGDFGSMVVAAGELDAGALWYAGPVGPSERRSLMDMVGAGAGRTQEQGR